ncbi:uncharacterized protein CANTADRAFT_24597 [Suhomyces tanzawaensis NRRL Y-17324]|uniref:Uncharacterized protein n=1 Tax=Suhomyces tanzawaensis NRRL Y-17324 TaxID=984487 RepID=A0A1E4SQL9_9ASCO|nr:uncharacterized protein CANTADRAFT_24597 [Suhomyces tanzawaensis NRRL Y-17324]ODV81806.1 hypothetical protein CANTADRAFT_24597 [Suhomyces tanzawaensis NRRL Y-17324]
MTPIYGISRHYARVVSEVRCSEHTTGKSFSNKYEMMRKFHLNLSLTEFIGVV